MNGVYCGMAMPSSGYLPNQHFGGAAMAGNDFQPVPQTAFVPNNQHINRGQNPNMNGGQGGPRIFNGNCNHCNQWGHRAAECPLKANQNFGRRQGFGNGNQAGRPRVPCRLCGQTTHMENRCWENPANAAIRPQGWSSRLRIGPLTQQQVDQILAGQNAGNPTGGDRVQLNYVQGSTQPG